MREKIAVVYHNADFDGLLSREICEHFLTKRPLSGVAPEVHTFGWDYGQPAFVPTDGWHSYSRIFIVDITYEPLLEHPELSKKVIWIDHHRTSIDKYDNQKSKHYLQGYRIEGVAACRLVYQWFTNPSQPTLEHYTARHVDEPELVRLVGEHDIFDHRDSRTLPLQFGLKALSLDEFSDFARAELSRQETCDLEQTAPPLDLIVSAGMMISRFARNEARRYAESSAYSLDWDGLHWCALNVGQRGNSQLFDGAIKPDHDALFAWRYDGRQVYVSLYHAPGKEEHDLSVIAKKWGGGGHKGACGFRQSMAWMVENGLVK